MIDRPREKCGVFGIFAPGEDVGRLTFFGLQALQHRGQESAGIATSDRGRLHIYAEMGLVTQVFDERALASVPGTHAVGHTRYSTTGASRLQNAQPLIVKGVHGELAIAHNGNLVNAELVRDALVRDGVEFGTSSDTEVIRELPGQLTGGRLARAVRPHDAPRERRLLPDDPDRRGGLRDPRPARDPSALHRSARRPLCLRLGELCPRHLGSDLPAGRRAG